MRIFYTFCLLTLHGILLHGQSSAVYASFGALSEQDYELMKQKSDAAVIHEKTKSWSKAWYYRGLAYQGLAYSGKPAWKTKYPSAGIEAAKSLITSNDLEQKRPDQVDLDSQSKLLGNQLLTEGVGYFNNKDYQTALQYFESSIQLAESFNRVDSLAVFNAALSADNAQDISKAIEYYMKSEKIGYKSETSLVAAAMLYKLNDQPLKSVELYEYGIEKYPNNPALITGLVNHYLKEGKKTEAKDLLDKLINESYDNAVYYFTRAALGEAIGEQESTIQDYEKAIQLDPNYFDAYYNYGVYYYNQGVSLNNLASNSTDQQVYLQKKKEAKLMYLRAEPLLEKSFELKPNNQNAKASLLQLYLRLDRTDKYNQLKG